MSEMIINSSKLIYDTKKRKIMKLTAVTLAIVKAVEIIFLIFKATLSYAIFL